ncbi:hypothetical protein D3C87_1808660 [compost metagenome]
MTNVWLGNIIPHKHDNRLYERLQPFRRFTAAFFIGTGNRNKDDQQHGNGNKHCCDIFCNGEIQQFSRSCFVNLTISAYNLYFIFNQTISIFCTCIIMLAMMKMT